MKAQGLSINVFESVTVAEGLAAGGASADGAAEGVRIGEPDRMHSEDRSEEHVDRQVQIASPRPRDPKGELEEQENLAVATALLPRFNEEHGMDYAVARAVSRKEDQGGGQDSDRGVDGWLEMSQTGSYYNCELQVVKAISNQELWKDLAASGSHQTSDIVKSLCDDIWGSVYRKAKRAVKKSKTILVLDGSGATKLDSILDRFVELYDDKLESINFPEVWFVDPTWKGLVRRLKRCDALRDQLSKKPDRRTAGQQEVGKHD